MIDRDTWDHLTEQDDWPALIAMFQAAYPRRRVPSNPADSRYYGHPQVCSWYIDPLGGDTSCRVTGSALPARPSWSPGLWVRETLGRVLVDMPSGDSNQRAGSLDEGIEWALAQAGTP